MQNHLNKSKRNIKHLSFTEPILATQLLRLSITTWNNFFRSSKPHTNSFRWFTQNTSQIFICGFGETIWKQSPLRWPTIKYLSVLIRWYVQLEKSCISLVSDFECTTCVFFWKHFCGFPTGLLVGEFWDSLYCFGVFLLLE